MAFDETNGIRWIRMRARESERRFSFSPLRRRRRRAAFSWRRVRFFFSDESHLYHRVGRSSLGDLFPSAHRHRHTVESTLHGHLFPTEQPVELDQTDFRLFGAGWYARSLHVQFELCHSGVSSPLERELRSVRQKKLGRILADHLSVSLVFRWGSSGEEETRLVELCLHLAFSTLQASSWILVFGSLNRYFLIKKIAHFQFIRQRRYTTLLCVCLSLFFYVINFHILIFNGFHSSSTGQVICYANLSYPTYMIWYQRLHLFFYSVIPSFILLLLNSSLMKTVFASKQRLKNHQRSSSTSEPSERLSTFSSRKSRRNYPQRSMTRPNRKLTLSLVFLTFSYFVLTFPSTVIFSFFRPHIEPIQLRRTLSLLFTNLSTTTHAIRFLIYFFCSTDFRRDFSQLFAFRRRYSQLSLRKRSPTDPLTRTTNLSLMRVEWGEEKCLRISDSPWCFVREIPIDIERHHRHLTLDSNVVPSSSSRLNAFE